MSRTFGANSKPKRKGEYISMLKKDKDGWELFNLYVRPVINDINNFSFIGMFDFIPIMRKKIIKLKKLMNLCVQLEDLTAELDSIRLYEKRKKIKILDIKTKGGKLEIIDQGLDDEANKSIQMLKDEYNKLEIRWKEWLKVINEK